MKKTRLSDIFNADSIRNKKRILDRFEINKKEKRLFLDAIEEIENNEGGSGDGGGSNGGGSNGGNVLEEKDCNFYDYDGTLLYSYTKEEALALTELPPLPTNERFVYEDWNYTLEDIVSEEGDCNVGALCHTADDNIHVFLKTLKDNETITLKFTVYSNNTATTIDFGDGVVETYSEVVKDSYNAWMTVKHTFEIKGDYEIKIDTYRFGFGGKGVNINSTFCITETGYYPIKEVNISTRCTNVSANFYNRIKLNTTSSTSLSIDKFGGTYDIYFLTLPRRITTLSYQQLYFANPMNMSLPATLTTIGSSNFANTIFTQRLKYPKSVTTLSNNFSFSNTPNYNYSIDTYPVVAKKDFVFKNLVASVGFARNPYVEYITYINCQVIAPWYLCSNLKAIIIISDFVPTLSSTNTASPNPQIVVSDNIYDDIIVATNWANYASLIIKQSEYEANQ